MPNVFPGIGPLGVNPGSYGGTDSTAYRRMVRTYDDNSYRSYAKSTAKHRTLTVPFKSISKTRRDAIESFFIANWNLEFYLYCWPETSVVDPTGASTTGRHLARFDSDPELVFTNNASCTYECSLAFILLS